MRLSTLVAKWLAIAASLGATACGVSQELYIARANELNHCQTDIARMRADLTQEHSSSDQLSSEVGQLRDQLGSLEGDRRALATNLSATQAEVQQVRRAQAQSERRSELYRGLVAKLRPVINTRALAVEVRNRRILIKLPDSSLFEPGRADLKAEGQGALRAVAGAMREITDRDFIVAGHTDNMAVRNSPFHSNWELSTARAVAVVRFLQGEGVDPRRLGAAGYSEFSQLGDNATSEGREQNHRIEVVVMPNSDELPAIDSPSEPLTPQAR